MRMIHSLWLCLAFLSPIQSQTPLNDIAERKLMIDRKPLAYPAVQERDIFWEKRVTRVVYFKEKMNQFFQSPQSHFMEIIFDGIQNGDIQAYSTEGEAFSNQLTRSELDNILVKKDTVQITDLNSGMIEDQLVTDELDLDKITHMRMEEIWFFDSKYSKMNVRIISLAPIMVREDDFGNAMFEMPLFTIHYPSAREYLSQFLVAHEEQSRQPITWEDQLEMRFFASTIYQVSNVSGDRLKDRYSGIDLLREAEKEKLKIQNFEHDLWSY